MHAFSDCLHVVYCHLCLYLAGGGCSSRCRYVQPCLLHSKRNFSYSDARLTHFREVTRSRSLLLGTSALIQDFSLCKACHSAFKETPRLTCDQVVEDVHLEPCYHQLPSPECCLPLPSASPRARLPQLGWVQGWLPPSCSCTPCR